MPQIDAGEFKKGTKVILEGEPYDLLEVNFVKPGKGSALYRLRMRNLLKNTIIDRTLKSGDGLEGADVRKADGQFLYKDRGKMFFMDSESFDQYELPETILGDTGKLMQDGMLVQLTYWNENVIEVTPPQHVNLKVTYTEPAVRGNTSGNVTKAATVETGAEVLVPLFIDTGDVIRIDTASGTYMERVKQ